MKRIMILTMMVLSFFVSTASASPVYVNDADLTKQLTCVKPVSDIVWMHVGEERNLMALMGSGIDDSFVHRVPKDTVITTFSTDPKAMSIACGVLNFANYYESQRCKWLYTKVEPKMVFLMYRVGQKLPIKFASLEDEETEADAFRILDEFKEAKAVAEVPCEIKVRLIYQMAFVKLSDKTMEHKLMKMAYGINHHTDYDPSYMESLLRMVQAKI